MSGFDILIIVAYFVAMLLVGAYVGKKQKSSDDFFMGGRSLGLFSLTSLWVSGWIGGTAIIATSANAYEYGISAIWYVMAYSVGVLLFGLTMVDRVKRVGNKLNSVTITDFMEARYDVKTGCATTVCAILSAIATVAAQFVAGASILSVITGWDYNTSYLVTGVVITCYVATGGLMAVTYTDQVQLILILIGVFACVFLTGNTLRADEVSLVQALPSEAWDLGGMGWDSTIATAVSSIMSYYTIMSSYTRIICAKDAKTAKKATVVSAVLVAVICLSTTFIGLAAKLIVPGISTGSNVLAYLIMNIFPTGVKGLVLVAILCAVMSTADVSVLLASTCFCNDVYKRFINKNAKDSTLKLLGVVGSVAAGVLAFFMGKTSSGIMEYIQLSFTINSAGIFLPIICAFFWKRGNSRAAFASVLSSVVIVVVWFIGSKATTLPIFQISSFWPAIAVSSVLFIIMSIVIKPDEEDKRKAEIFIA